jgi:hypothetical protein
MRAAFTGAGLAVPAEKLAANVSGDLSRLPYKSEAGSKGAVVVSDILAILCVVMDLLQGEVLASSWYVPPDFAADNEANKNIRYTKLCSELSMIYSSHGVTGADVDDFRVIKF